MKYARPFVLLFVIAALMMVSLAPTSAQENILRYPILAEPEHLNPFTAETISVATVLRNIHQGMIHYDAASGEVVPSLAESWEVTEDEQGRQVYTFHLRQGVMFHDVAGIQFQEREVTSDIILWNYMTALSDDPDTSAFASLLSPIAGASAYTAGDATTVEGLQTPDRYTFQITLDVPDRLFLINGAGLAITSPEAYAQLGSGFERNPVGTGPFQLESWQPGLQLTLRANPDYWNPSAPLVDGIQFILQPDAESALAAYRADELDFLFDIPGGERDLIQSEFADEFHEQPSLHVRYFGFNMESGFLAENPLVRQAMNYALDRDRAWNEIDEGARFPADLGILPPAMPASTPATIYTYDLDRAAELLAEAGYPNGEGIPTITINVLDAIAGEAHLEVWREGLAAIGISAEFKAEDGTTYWDTIEQDDTMVFVNGWASGLVDPANVFDFIIRDGVAPIKYDNPAVNDLLEAASIELDEAARADLYQQAHDMIMADSAVVPSAYSKITWLQKPWISGFEPGGGGTFTAPLWQVSTGEPMTATDAPIYQTVSAATLLPGDDIPAPSEDRILTVTGTIGTLNDETQSQPTVNFDMATLESIGLVEYDVTDIVEEEGDVTFQGVLLSDLLAAVGTFDTAQEVFITALDGYAIVIPMSDIESYPVLLATQINGERMDVERRGPTRIVYPRDDFDFDPETNPNFWIWNVDVIEVR